MSSFLFAVWAGGGNVPPQLALARRLLDRGHQVRMLAPAVLRETVEEAGVVFEPYVKTPEHDEASAESSLVRDFEARSPKGALEAMRDRVLVGMAEPVAHDVTSILGRETVDVVAPDWVLLGALFAAEKWAVPAAPLVHSVLSIPVEGMPPFGFGWTPASGPLGRLRDTFGKMMFERMLARPMLVPLNELRRKLDLPALTWAFDALFGAERLLVLSSRAFDYPACFPDNVVYVGPQLDDADWHPSWQPPWPENDPRPLVVVGLSTTYQAHERLLENIVEALGGLPVRALVTTGKGLSVPKKPDNVHVESFVPHPRLLPYADLVVTHAGHGTAMASLTHGVPLVCLPVGRDQPDIAARVVWHGAGTKLSPRSKPDKIARAISEVLSDDTYRHSARRLAEAIAAEEPQRRGVETLEQLASLRHQERPL
jgi:MGT family glycosyltransferase